MPINQLPKISIVTPSFNQAQFLEATILSILSQNYPNLEYNIIDGGSTDGSVEIIQKYAEHLHFWCSEPDAGQYDAINKGFAHSTGEIMAWLNSDDMYFPWTLKTVASIMSELAPVEWLTTFNIGFWDWHGFCADIGNIPGYSREAFLDGRYFRSGRTTINWIQQESTFWRRGLWEKVGGYISTDFKLASDFDLWARFYNHTDLYGTSSPLGGFRSQPSQRSRQIEQYVLEAKQSLAQMRTEFNWKPNLQRELALQLKFHQIPKVRTLSSPLYRYQGKRVVRKNLESPQGHWITEEHQFA
jgi:glycosyltransferase involved in cell wall biosynthesis